MFVFVRLREGGRMYVAAAEKTAGCPEKLKPWFKKRYREWNILEAVSGKVDIRFRPDGRQPLCEEVCKRPVHPDFIISEGVCADADVRVIDAAEYNELIAESWRAVAEREARARLGGSLGDGGCVPRLVTKEEYEYAKMMIARAEKAQED